MEKYKSKHTGAEIDAGIDNANAAFEGLAGKLDADKLPEAVNAALAQAKASGEFDGKDGKDGTNGTNGKDGTNGIDGEDGQRGTGVLRVTTAPSIYRITTNGVLPTYRTTLSSIISESGINEVLVGDCLSFSYYLYRIYYIDDSYAYIDKYWSLQGVPGEPGIDGTNGEDGISATHSWNGTTLTITSASGTSSANLKGDKGDKGDDGTSVGIHDIQESELAGDFSTIFFTDGNNLNIRNGKDGTNGNDGVGIKSVVQTTSSSEDGGSNVITVTKTDNTTSTFTVKNGSKGSAGKDGTNGTNGTNGKDGTSVTVKSVSESTADGGNNVVTFSDGKTLTVKNGSQGVKGDKGDPYTLTDTDKNTIAAAVKSSLPKLTLVGTDKDGVAHTWTIYGS